MIRGAKRGGSVNWRGGVINGKYTVMVKKLIKKLFGSAVISKSSFHQTGVPRP